MKKLLLSALTAGLFAVPSMSHAAVNPYASVSGGISLLNKSDLSFVPDVLEWNTGYNVTGALGLQIDPVRVEAAVGYQTSGLSKIGGSDVSIVGFEFSMWTVMANTYYDFHIKNSGISPYIMGGIGFASTKNSYPMGVSVASTSVFAYQLGCGIGIKATDKLTVDLGYRYVKPSNPTSYPGIEYSIASNDLQLGLRVGI